MNITIKGGPLAQGVSVVTDDGRQMADKIRSITWRATAGDICRAEIELCAVTLDQVGAAARVFIGGREVRRVEYADGTVEEYGA